MQLTWPQKLMNSTLSDAQLMLAMSAAAGFANGVLSVNTMQTLPGEITEFVPVSAVNGSATPPVVGWPSGNYRAGFCIHIPSWTDADRQVNVGLAWAAYSEGVSLAAIFTQPS